MKITFRVYGVPRPGGSKKFMGRSKKTGKPIIIDDCEQNRAWRDTVAAYALPQRPHELLSHTLRVDIIFFMPRPKYHFHSSAKKRGQLKDNAPKYHNVAPDRTKLMRSTEDALTGILWQDDALIAAGMIEKLYVSGGETPGALIQIEEIE